MNTEWRRTQLPQIVATLATRPGHENVRTQIAEILHNAFAVAYHALDQEVRLPEVRGRIDTLFGATVFEFKKDLRQELPDVLAKLPDYLGDRERKTARRFLGIATDGATFRAFELRDGALVEVATYTTRPDRPDELLAWLEPALSDRDDLAPEPHVIQRELGRESLTYGRARNLLERIWPALASHPEVALKRQLWDGLLREVYGTEVGDDRLFLQHTYLTIVAKTIAACVLDLDIGNLAAPAILSGRALTDIGIHGAVESDFFDWILEHPDGADLVRRIARQTARFRLRDAKVDVLKALYESLIDPTQRHDLGEYYTPDWLAAKLARAAIEHPLTQRVLDPSCGSGTFLFHAIRRILAAAAEAGLSHQQAVEACARNVRGLDIHPVAIIIARATWLLALRDAILHRPAELHVPVFLGDALQWNIDHIGDSREVVQRVPNDRPLRIPAGFAEDQDRFEPGLRTLTEGLADDATPAQVSRNLQRIAGVTVTDAEALGATFAHLQALYRAGRDGIWPFVLRNLVRPLWLSRADQRADVVIGNPPWVAYRHLSAELKTRLKEACIRDNLWIGGKLATQQDLSALFFSRATERYLKPGGTIAFVLPYAALNRPAFEGLRRGDYNGSAVRITAAWSFDETVQPLFPVPACVIIGRRQAPTHLPATVTRFSGHLPRRDATEDEANPYLTVAASPWPPIPTLAGASPYRSRFSQGATIVPRRFFLVERLETGRLGASAAAPMVTGRIGGQDKAPWNTVTPPLGPIEKQFLRHVLLGESIAPYRVIATPLAVIPFDGKILLDSTTATAKGHRHLARWLRDIETKWGEHAARKLDRSLRISLRQRLDFMRGLTGQFPVSELRVVYPQSGTLLCAAVLGAGEIVEHKAYWASARSRDEANYLVAILNAEEVRRRIAAMQSKGQGGARDFDLLPFELKIPEFTSQDPLHLALAAAAAHAEKIAASVPLDPAAYFTINRRTIREALIADGIAARIETLVTQLLPPYAP